MPPTPALAPIPYLPIEQHAVIGDRRTAALVATNGTVDWLCLPDYADAPLFGALVDAERGGYWRIGPKERWTGQQRFLDDTAALVTTWTLPGGTLEVTDLMAWPQDARPAEVRDVRAVLRRIRCTHGDVSTLVQCNARDDFDADAHAAHAEGGYLLHAGKRAHGLWATFPLHERSAGIGADLDLHEGDEHWIVLALGEAPERWSRERAEAAYHEAHAYWHDWCGRLTYHGPEDARVRQSALLVHLLSYAPTGSLVAAPTTSLPERIGGSRNYDYRFAWVRDASLSLAVLSILGRTETAQRYMDWLAGLGSATDAPLQVVYRTDGGTDLAQHERKDLAGYRESPPVVFGNRAAKQRQLDSFGYFADCAHTYLEHGGIWKPTYWHLVERVADYVAAHWQEPDSGIWELPTQAHYLSSKVMSWVTLDRALKVAERTGEHRDTTAWQQAKDAVFAQVMEQGWSDHLGAFRQAYGEETLDASALLMGIMGFLPPTHPRMRATVERIEEHLTINDFVYRFQPRATPGEKPLPLGEFEGAFLPATFWLATTYAMQGRTHDAERILRRAETLAGEPTVFGEEADARGVHLLGNTPLLFSYVEYVRAILAVAKQHPIDHARLMLGQMEQKAEHLLDHSEEKHERR